MFFAVNFLALATRHTLGSRRLGLAVARVRSVRLTGAQYDDLEGDDDAPTMAEPFVVKPRGKRTLHADYAVVRSMDVPADLPLGTRLPIALTLLAPDQFASLSRARKTCRQSQVLVNGAVADCSAAVAPGDTIALQLRVNPGYAPSGVAPFHLEIVYEDDDLAVVLKPAGVVTYPPPGGVTGSRSMRTAIIYALKPPPAGTPGALYRPHLVHRLDKPTSGLMLAAKTKPAHVCVALVLVLGDASSIKYLSPPLSIHLYLCIYLYL